MKKLSSLTKSAILIGLCFIILKYVVAPPLPSSLVYLYMALVIIAILAQISIEDEKLQEFVRPVKNILVREEKAKTRMVLFSAFPLVVAVSVFSSFTVRTDPPAELRTIHPAPPSEIEFRGEKTNLVKLENPYRSDTRNYNEYVEEGRAIYHQNCHFCHGDNLDGEGMFAEGFSPRPTNFGDPGTIAMLEESFLFWRITKGGPGLPKVSTPWNSAMPVWENMLTKDEIWKVILFIYDATGQTPRTWESVVVEQDARKGTPNASLENNIVDGKQIYEEKCAHCHGMEGKGDGPAAERLSPRPRDFTRGKFKIRSTESRQLPSDEDLFNIITKGMPGTSMPGWEDLSERDRRKLVDYLKTFSRRFALADEPPREIGLRDRVRLSEKSVAQGRQVYEELECFTCHGQEGRGDGQSALDLVDEWNDPIRPADLTESWTFRGGSSVEEIYKRFISGLDGTPMPSITESFVLDEEIEDIQIKIEDEEPLTPEEREKFEKAMKEIRVKSWNLANYVWSLAPEEKPEVRVVLKSRLVEGELPREIDDPRWDEIESNIYPLVGQVIVEPRNFTPSIDAVFVKSMYNVNEIVFLMTWTDHSLSINSTVPADAPGRTEEKAPTVYDDAIALQFPVKLSDGPERPYFLMGDARNSVYIWRWKGSDSFGRESDPGGVTYLTEVNAKGMMRLTEQPEESQNVYAKVSFSNGQYRLLAKRPLVTENDNDLQFEIGTFIPIALFAWDGSRGETGARCSVSTWYYLLLVEPSSPRRYLFAPIAALMAVIFEIFILKGVRRRKEEFS